MLTSPTIDEVAHLPAGISHWQFGRVELYRVNPPLVRMTAALPVMAAGAKTEWKSYWDRPFARPEFGVGKNFIEANGPESLHLFTLARWACIPFSVVGALVCFAWARRLYGDSAGLLAMALWCFCPNILGHGQLITPDVAGAALSLAATYAFWRWLQEPSFTSAVLGGLVLGAALLTKTTNILLLPVFLLISAFWGMGASTGTRFWPRISQSCGILLMSVFVLNAGYAFQGTFQPLGDFAFESTKFGRPRAQNELLRTANRFSKSWLGHVPVPLPADYVRGIDVQTSDFEGQRVSYLRGHFQRGGWWYYYLYAMLVKVPLGIWLLFLLAVFLTLWHGISPIGWLNELVLLCPIMAFFLFVSSETGFTSHLRYVFPIFPFLFIWTSRVASPVFWNRWWIRIVTTLCISWVLIADVVYFPHHLSYFNELAGGPANGPKHLLDSNIDWGQDLITLKKWADDHPEAGPIHVAYFGFNKTSDIFPELRPIEENDCRFVPRPGWFAISVNFVHGYDLGGLQKEPKREYLYFQGIEPVARAGYSMNIYYISPKQAQRLQLQLGYPPVGD